LRASLEEANMKTLIATGLACALVATSIAPAAAAAATTACYVTQPHSAVSLVGDRGSSRRSDRDWDSDQVGSSSWWQQMDRDQRGGRR
jgi:hypothetical protein